MTKIIIPFIHMNGTSKEELLDLREEFYTSLLVASDKLAEMSPNGRDYYPDPGRMEKAINQHDERMDALRKLIDGIQEEVDAICDL